jgi:hypothetical protein
MRRDWSVYVAISLAGLNAIWTFFLVFFFPAWAIIVIALDVLLDVSPRGRGRRAGLTEFPLCS